MFYYDWFNEEVFKCVKNDLCLFKLDNCFDIVLEVLEKCWEGNFFVCLFFVEIMVDVLGIIVDSYV